MYFSNAKVDVVFALSEEHHFDDETFQEGRDVITAGTRHCFCTKDINDDAHNDSICKFYPLGMVNQAQWRLITKSTLNKTAQDNLSNCQNATKKIIVL